MSKKPRWTLEVVTARVIARMKERNVPVKAACAALGIDAPSFSRKANLDRSGFTIDEFAQLADMLDAPPGWPFIE